MRLINVTLDLYSIAVSLTVLCYLIVGKQKRDKLCQGFILLCMVNILMILGDLANWIFEGVARPWYPAALWAGVLLFWICSSLILLIFTGYIMEYLSPRVRIHKNYWNAAVALCAVHIICIVLSLWNGMFFTVSQGNFYQRGEWFWLSQLIPFSIYGLDVAIFTVYRKSLSRKDFRILSSYIILPILAEVIQMFNYGIALLNTGITLSILIIFINIQSEQELRLERQERELTQARVDIMLSQIKPHFLYNTLTAIRQMCDSNPRQAKESIRDFTLFLRANMDSLGSKAPIPFEQELKHTESYLKLEQQRQQDRLHVVYEIGVRDFSIPPLTMQPIVENAVRYGALSREEGGTVLLRTEETRSAYCITIQDDGLGFRPGTVNSDERSHMGIENVRQRLALLCSGTLELRSIEGSGTTAVITIPKEKERS